MRRKAGFTLVELVVVIAILAILAAIAIPAVIGIVNSAANTALESEAATIDQSSKTYYKQIKTGMVTSDRFKAERSGDTIPSRATSLTGKARLARRCTVGGALEYAAVYSDFVGRLDEFAYDTYYWEQLGRIYYEKNDFPKAKECFEFIEAIEPDNTSAHMMKAGCLFSMDQWEEAFKIYRSLLAHERY